MPYVEWEGTEILSLAFHPFHCGAVPVLPVARQGKEENKDITFRTAENKNTKAEVCRCLEQVVRTTILLACDRPSLTSSSTQSLSCVQLASLPQNHHDSNQTQCWPMGAYECQHTGKKKFLHFPVNQYVVHLPSQNFTQNSIHEFGFLRLPARGHTVAHSPKPQLLEHSVLAGPARKSCVSQISPCRYPRALANCLYLPVKPTVSTARRNRLICQKSRC